MNEPVPTPEQQEQIDAFELEFAQRLERVGVDLQGIGARLRESQRHPTVRLIDDQ